MDEQAILSFIANAEMHAEAGNDWGEGYWIGRAVSHAEQNAISKEWLAQMLKKAGLIVPAAAKAERTPF